jgi:LuxR family transcriptional regulator, activator of conjugal transfer of Ti plasmids
MESAVTDFLDKMAAVDDLEGLRRELDSLCDQMGLDHFAYLGVSLPTAGITDPFTICCYSDEWVEHYKSRQYLAADPVVKAGLQRPLPFEWREFNEEPDHRQFFGEANEFGIGSSGLTVPVRGANGEFAILNASSRMRTPVWERHIEQYRHQIHLVGIYYHAAVAGALERTKNTTAPVLTKREVECLLWAAKGKTAWETSKILNVSERTVIFHINNSKAKLNTYSKHHAVIKAIMLGIVSP